MCGIAGASLHPDEKCAPTRIATAMLKAIEHRGRDATGAAWVAPQSLAVYFQKDNVPASKFVPQLNLEGARTFILHTRYGTKGSATNQANNHPIVLPGMVGIHNGMLRNDDALFAMLGEDTKRYGQVDSEAAFALLNADDKTPTTHRLGMLEGSAALAWLQVDDEGCSDRVLHLARVAYSPLVLGFTPKGSVLFASTYGAVRAAATVIGVNLTHTLDVKEGTYLRIHRGAVQGWESIPGRAPAATPKQQTLPAGKAKAKVLTTPARGPLHGVTDLFDKSKQQVSAESVTEEREPFHKAPWKRIVETVSDRASYSTWDRDWWASKGRDGRK